MCHFRVSQRTAPLGFDAFHADCHADLVQQTYLLTGSPRRARRAVRQAFGAAAQRWDEVGELPDPRSWVRRRAFDAVLAPWSRSGPRRTAAWRLPRRTRPAARETDATAGPATGADASPARLTDRDRALLRAMMALSGPRRRALVLHDALGLAPEAVAVETESSTGAALDRVRAARAALARAVPESVGSDPDGPGFGERLGGLLYRMAERGCPAPAPPSAAAVRSSGRVRAAALPAAAGLLVLGTLGAIGSTLAGSGPSSLFAASRQAAPLPVCAAPVGPENAATAAPGAEPALAAPASPTPAGPRGTRCRHAPNAATEPSGPSGPAAVEVMPVAVGPATPGSGVPTPAATGGPTPLPSASAVPTPTSPTSPTGPTSASPTDPTTDSPTTTAAPGRTAAQPLWPPAPAARPTPAGCPAWLLSPCTPAAPPATNRPR